MGYLDTKDKLKITLLILLLVLAVIYFPKISNIYSKGEDFLKSRGPVLGPLFYGGLMIISILISPVPSSPLVIIGSIIFGSWPTLIYTLIFATLGAVLAFLLARFLLWNYIHKEFKDNLYYQRILNEDNKKLIYIVGLSRLMPQFPFDAVSYLAGLTNMKLWKFTFATFIGMIPIVAVFSFLGNRIEPYKVTFISIIFTLLVIYMIYKIVMKKRYYVKGY